MVNEMGTTETTENHSFLPMAAKKKRMSLSTSRLSFSSVSQKFPVIFPTGSRLFKILYQLSIKVKTGGGFCRLVFELVKSQKLQGWK